MKTCNISHQIIETISGNLSCTFKIDSVEFFHNFCMVWDFKVRNNRFAKFFNFDILAVVFTDRYRWIDDIWDNHHIFFDFCFNFFFFSRKFFHTGSVFLNFFLKLFCFLFFAMSHACTDFFGNFIFLSTECFYFAFDFTVSLVKFDYFIYKWKLFILEFFLDVFFYNIRVLS